MRVVIAGGHGKIALRLTRRLAARGDEAVGIIRNPEHRADVEAAGGEAAVADLEDAAPDALLGLLDGADAAVFAAGAGPGSGAARKESVDKGASALLADAAERVGVRRHLQVSAMGLDRADDESLDEVFRVYLRAKAEAEADLRRRALDWTILRPGRLTDDGGTGLVSLGEGVGRADVPREDVAAALVALLDEPRTAGRTLGLVAGGTPLSEAVAALL